MLEKLSMWRLLDLLALMVSLTLHHTGAAGLTGTLSPHRLRYAFAQGTIKHYQSQGYSHKKPFDLTALDLDHSDER